jgi:hypothetical protein
MSRSGGSRESDPSAVVEEVFYVMQQRMTRLLKMGRCLRSRVEVRRREHETSGGPHRVLFLAPGDSHFEKDVFRRLRKYRLRGEERADFEIFRPAPDVWNWLRSNTAEALGFFAIGKAYRDTHTAKAWLKECAAFGCEPAEFALREETRLRKRVPRSARGGWVLWEMISGRLSKQMLLDFDGAFESHGLAHSAKLNEWPLHRVTYKGIEFLFPVFLEACERMGVRPPPDAICVGIRPRSHRVPSGRKGRPLRAKEETVTVPHPVIPPEQEGLFR